MRFSISTLVIALLLSAGQASATAFQIQFEGFAPPGAVANINPLMPYMEKGFTLTPLNGESAVFSSTAPAAFPGDSTDWFGFAGGNTITLSGPQPFALEHLLSGPISFGSGSTDLTITGFLVGGGSVSGTWSNLTTATDITLNWSNLSSVTFNTNTDSGLDDIALVASVPEPLTLSLMAGGLAGAGALRRRKKAA